MLAPNKLPFRERCKYAVNMLIISGIGIAFIPFVPLAVLLGAWRIDSAVYSPEAAREHFPSFLGTSALGFLCYTTFVIWLVISLMD